MSEEAHGAILQRDKLTYAIVPRTPVGLISPEILEAVARVVRQYNIPIMKITSGQRLALVGIKKDDLEPVWQDLKMDIGRAVELCVHYVQACPGIAVCRYGVQDSLALGLELEEKFLGMELPAKVKMGVSGCPLCCGESYVRDIGLVGKKSGWILSFGGNSGSRPRIGDVLAEDLSRNEVVDFVGRCLEYYVKNGKKRERTARFIERTGLEAMKKVLGRS